MTPHHILPSQILKTEIISANTPHLLLDDRRLDVERAEGGVEADGGVEGPKEVRLRVGVAEEFQCGFVSLWVRAFGRA